MRDIIINKLNIDWVEIKNACRITVNKEPTPIEPTSEFKVKLLISEHSPIRLGEIVFTWTSIKSWVATHFARHWIGWEKWISTQRSDRTKVDRDNSPQGTNVTMKVRSNPQSAINVSKVRLCFQASKETREKMEGLKIAIKEAGEEEVALVMQPQCIYRCGCSEFESCGYWQTFLKNHGHENLYDIETRYRLADEDFYKRVK